MAGLRRFEAKQDDDGFYRFQFPLFGNILPAADLRHFEEDRLIKKYQLSYRPAENITVFGLASQGFRLGGTNQATVAVVPPGYEADSLWNYEVGVKSVAQSPPHGEQQHLRHRLGEHPGVRARSERRLRVHR